MTSILNNESEEWSSQEVFQFKQLEKRSLEKNQGFNGIRTRDLRDTGAIRPYQLSYEATHWERGQFSELSATENVVCVRVLLGEFKPTMAASIQELRRAGLKIDCFGGFGWKRRQNHELGATKYVK